MITEEIKQKFKQYLEKFTDSFQNTPSAEQLAALKDEANTFSKEDIIECWTIIFKAQGPVEEAGDNKYEIYDVTNFMGESTGSSNDYIHTVELEETDDSAAVFMKFYFVFHCLVNGMKSNEYSFTKAGSGSV